MTNEELMAKNEALDAIEEVLEHPGYAILEREIKRLRDQGEAECCNVKLPQAERDGGAGARNMGEQLLGFLKQKQKALAQAVGKEKSARSHKRQST